jgi:O-antigen/teichoic acid export membrane protein
MTMYGQTVTRAGSIFAIGMLGLLPFGILSLAITTRYLDPADYGHLTILFAISSIVTQFAGVGLMQGAIISSYRSGGDEEGDFDAEPEDIEPVDLKEVAETAEERMRMLGSGLLAVMGSSTIVCGVVALLGDPIASLFTGGLPAHSMAWAAASAWTGAVWRLVHQIPRMERQPASWAGFNWVRPGLVVACTVAALAAGYGVNGVLAATAGGTLATILIAFVIYRDRFRFAPRRGDVKQLWLLGKRFVLLHIARAVQSNVSVILLGVIAAPTSVALFQVATRIAQIPTYFGEGLILGWPVLRRSQIGIAAQERKGSLQSQALFFTLFALCTIGLLVAVSLLADTLIHIAAPAYEDAAGLIPIVAAGFAASAAFRGVYRATRFKRKRYWYMLLHVIWLAPFGATAWILAPWNETYGVAIAQIVAGVFVAACLVLMDKRAGEATPFQWKRLAVATALGVAVVAAVQLLPIGGVLHAVLAVAALVVFPLLVMASGAVPRGQVPIVKAIIASVFPRRLRKKQMRRELASMPETERDAVLLIACERQEPEAAAASLGVSEPIVSARLTRGLRRFADSDPKATPVDHLIGEYVMHTGGTIERDLLGDALRNLGVDPLQLHFLDDAAGRVKKLKADKIRRELGVGPPTNGAPTGIGNGAPERPPVSVN